MPKDCRVRKRRDFLRVYENGIRIKGRFMTAFVMASETSFHRIGITASKKAIGNAVKRNRAKRVLREAFRLNKANLALLEKEYDWVLNARREILEHRMQDALAEFSEMISKVEIIESKRGD